MNKKTITGLLVFSVLIILFSFNIKASIFATIGMKGLSFASPEAAGVVQNVMKAYQITADPSGFITGEITGQLTGEIMGEIAKQSPEAAQAIQQYQQVKGWIDEGAKITEDLKLDDKGQLVGGSATITKKQNVESITDSKVGEIENMKVSSNGEGSPYQLEAAENGASATVGGNTYSNLQKGSTITVNRETGKIDEMDATFTEATTIKVNEDELKVPKGARVVYKDGKYDIYGKDQEVEINKQKIHINGENSINYDGKKITGKDFTYDEKRFTGLEGKDAEVTIVEEGYLLGKNTAVESDRMIIESKEGNVLYSNMCGDVSGFNNYVNPCRRTLSMEGEGFSVQLKEGKSFGLDIEKDDVLKYEFNGGKVVIDNGAQNIATNEKGEVTVTNGDFKITYTKIGGVPHTMMDPNSIGKSPDVAMSTTCGDISSIENPDGAQTVYACPSSGTGAAVTGAASFFQRCTAALGVNTEKTNKFIGTELFEKQKITTVGPVIPYQRPDGTTDYTVSIETTDVAGNTYKYSLSSDGTITKWNPEKLEWEETDYMITSEADLKEFGVIREEATKPEPELSPVEKMEERGRNAWDNLYQDSKASGKLKEGQLYLGVQRKGYYYLQPSDKGPVIINTDFAVRPIKDSAGNVIRFESYDGSKAFKPIGGGKVEQIR